MSPQPDAIPSWTGKPWTGSLTPEGANDFHVILQVPEGGAGEPPGPKAVETEN